MRFLRALSVGLALAVVAALLNHVPVAAGEVALARADRSFPLQVVEFFSLILDSGWAWAAAAVLAGRLAGPQLPAGAAGGSSALVLAAIVYDLLEDGGFVRYFWVLTGLVLGLFLGAVGALTHRPGLVGLVAALVVPVGAALAMVVDPPAVESPAAPWVMVTVWVGAAAFAIYLARTYTTSARSSPP